MNSATCFLLLCSFYSTYSRRWNIHGCWAWSLSSMASKVSLPQKTCWKWPKQQNWININGMNKLKKSLKFGSYHPRSPPTIINHFTYLTILIILKYQKKYDLYRERITAGITRNEKKHESYKKSEFLILSVKSRLSWTPSSTQNNGNNKLGRSFMSSTSGIGFTSKLNWDRFAAANTLPVSWKRQQMNA